MIPRTRPPQAGLKVARQRTLECRQFMSQRLDELELFDRRTANLAHRLYESALACRMRPFADGTRSIREWCAISPAPSVSRSSSSW